MKDINKDIENLEEIINLINKELDKKDKNVSAILDLKDLLSLRNLIKEYKELEEENIQLEACKDEAIIRYNFESIPVSLVEEKIEEKTSRIKYLNNELEKSYKELEEKGTETEIDILEEYIFNMETENTIRHSERRALEELLEKRE